MTTFGYGLASAADGRVYDWVFPIGTTYWGQMAAMINKEMVDMAYETTLTQGLYNERRLFQVLVGSEDKKEGMTAFVEKRPAVWKHR